MFLKRKRKGKIMPKSVKIAEEEIREIRGILLHIQNLHTTIGAMRERETGYLSRLLSLRRSEAEWEEKIEKKYELPHEGDWKVDAANGQIVFEGESKTEETEKNIEKIK